MSEKRVLSEDKKEYDDEIPDCRVEVEDESEAVDQATLAPETPATFTLFVHEQEQKFDKSRFRNNEHFEWFCMLPLPDTEKAALLDKMSKDSRPGHKRRATSTRN